jgi:hypothetical protein
MKIEFLEETHQYFVDGIEKPSVTTILKEVFGGMEDIPLLTLQKAGERGTIFHAITEMQDKKFPEYEIIEYQEKAEKAYFEAYGDDWKANAQLNTYNALNLPKWEKIEEQFYCAELGYVGTVDRISATAIYDTKTSSAIDRLKWSLQTTAYAMPFGKKECYAIWLPRKGNGKIIKLDYIPDDWLAVLRVYNLKKGKKK